MLRIVPCFHHLLLQVRDSKHPKKPMNDLGADGMMFPIPFCGSPQDYLFPSPPSHPSSLPPTDFLPLFVWVLVQCGFYRAEIEAEYMWGLAHPSLFNGEAGYYLTTLTSAGELTHCTVSHSRIIQSGNGTLHLGASQQLLVFTSHNIKHHTLISLSAVNVLKELTQPPAHLLPPVQVRSLCLSSGRGRGGGCSSL